MPGLFAAARPGGARPGPTGQRWRLGPGPTDVHGSPAGFRPLPGELRWGAAGLVAPAAAPQPGHLQAQLPPEQTAVRPRSRLAPPRRVISRSGTTCTAGRTPRERRLEETLEGKAASMDGVELPTELRDRLERDLACVKLLQQLRPSQQASLAAAVAADAGEEQRQIDTVDAEDADAGTPSPSPAFKRLGRFEIRRELGRGAFGIVYLAYDPQLRREVALKIPRADA